MLERNKKVVTTVAVLGIALALSIGLVNANNASLERAVSSFSAGVRATTSEGSTLDYRLTLSTPNTARMSEKATFRGTLYATPLPDPMWVCSQMVSIRFKKNGNDVMNYPEYPDYKNPWVTMTKDSLTGPSSSTYSVEFKPSSVLTEPGEYEVYAYTYPASGVHETTPIKTITVEPGIAISEPPEKPPAMSDWKNKISLGGETLGTFEVGSTTEFTWRLSAPSSPDHDPSDKSYERYWEVNAILASNKERIGTRGVATEVSTASTSTEWRDVIEVKKDHYYVDLLIRNSWTYSGTWNLSSSKLLDKDVKIAKVVSGTPKTYTLNAYAEPPEYGTVILQPSGGVYESGTEVTLTANPASKSYEFVRWERDVSGTSKTVTLTMDRDKEAVAKFKFVGKPGPFELTTEVAEGKGRIEVRPKENQYSRGTKVQLKAIPSNGYAFKKWGGDLSGSGNPTTVSMNSDKHVKAYFKRVEPPKVTLTIEKNPPSGGTVNVAQARNITVRKGKTVSLTAFPNEGFRFSRWSGAVDSESKTVDVPMHSDTTVVANFERTVGIGEKAKDFVTKNALPFLGAIWAGVTTLLGGVWTGRWF